MPRIFITGNGSGIGKAIEQECLARGWEVIGTHKDGRRVLDLWDFTEYATSNRLCRIPQCPRGTLLVNNAGILDHSASALDVFTINTVLPANLTTVFVTLNKCPVVVNIGSMWGETGGYGKRWAYAASKAALHNLTKTQARMYPQARINCVAPGIIDTPIHSDLAKHGDGHSIQGRIGTADEVAKVVAFLLSDEASYMTGAIVPVCGGR